MDYPKNGLKASYYLPYLSVMELIAIIITTIMHELNQVHIKSPFLDILAGTFKELEETAWFITLIGIVVLIIMLLITYKYQQGNSFHNRRLGWQSTHKLRETNKIKPQYKRVKVGDTWRNQKVLNPVEQAFNYAVKGWYIDQRADALTIWLLAPDQVDAQMIFQQRLPIIEANLRNYYPDYTFSPAECVGNYYRILANKF